MNCLNRALLLFAALCALTGCDNSFRFKDGDLIFRVDEGAYGDAISAVTQGEGGINYTHVGIADISGGEVTVIEATTPAVCRTPLDEFLSQAAKSEGRPIAAVGRLRQEYAYTTKNAIRYASRKIGLPYDYIFSTDTAAFYCSELVCRSFADSLGIPLFSEQPMNFRTADGTMPKEWSDRFASFGLEVPEGEQGSNPAALSRDDKLVILYRFFR